MQGPFYNQAYTTAWLGHLTAVFWHLHTPSPMIKLFDNTLLLQHNAGKRDGQCLKV